MTMLVCVGLLDRVEKDYSNKILDSIFNTHQNEYPNSHVILRLWKVILIPQLTWFNNLALLTVLLWFVLLSILTGYLAARYLNNPFNKTLYRYIVWISVQFCIIALFFQQIYIHIFLLCFPSTLDNKLVSPVER